MPLSRADFSTSASTSASSRAVARRGDDELHRRSADRAGQRRRREGDAPAPWRCSRCAARSSFSTSFWLRVRSPQCLEQDAGEALMHVAHAVDGEHVLLLGHRGVDLVELLGGVLEIIEIGVLRRLHQGEEDALVLFRRELPLRGHIHEPGRGDHANEHEQGHRPVVERAVQPALIALLQPVEHAVEEGGKAAPCPAIVRLQQPRAHHRRERERDHAGHQHGAGKSEGEFA